MIATELSHSRASDPQWPADAVRRIPVKQLVPYAKNARTHSATQIAQIMASIKEWGWTIPILFGEDEGLICGHGRVLAAAKMGLKEVPCMVAVGWTEAQKRAYIIADNQLTLNGAWDDGILKGELSALQDLDFNIELLGFDDDRLASLLVVQKV
jgi:ParB-like chromosome segregation protein Spo0J